MKDDESMRAYIVGERMRIPLNEEGDPPYEITYENLETGNSMETGENGERIMVSVAPSETMEWKYVSMIPARTLETDAKGIQILSVAGLFICGIVGFGLSGYMTRKNYNPLKSLIESFRKYGNTDIGRNDNLCPECLPEKYIRSELSGLSVHAHSERLVLGIRVQCPECG